VIEALLFVITGSVIMFGCATLVMAALTLQSVRRYVDLAEARMEHLHEEQTRLVALLREERRSPRPEPNEEPLATHRRHEGAGRHARRDAGQRIDQLKRELLGLPEVRQESSVSLSEASLEDMPVLKEEALPAREAERPAISFETTSGNAKGSAEDKKPRLAVWHPHPDDDVSPEKAPTGAARAQSEASVKMFRRHYDRYLENYEGYVKLAERLYRMRDSGESPPGSATEREWWEERLRRVSDGIKRTTARLDVLEEYNPELATDDRISRRESIARSHAELERSRRGHEGV
jgi:hypothetical protein